MRALISVYNKDKILEFAKKLVELKIEIISTGGTGKVFEENNIPFTSIKDLTGEKEKFDGRVKTLNSKIFSSILFRRDNPKDVIQLKEDENQGIDLIVCNLYDFQKGVESGVCDDGLIELVDIGGPSLIRAAAKNYKFTTAIVDPDDYDIVANELLFNKELSLKLKKELSVKSFMHTAKYDLLIAQTLNHKFDLNNSLSFSNNSAKLRYGENPHQKASVEIIKNAQNEHTLATAPILHGKEVSYNNYLDLDCAFKIVCDLKELNSHLFSVAIIKHGIPCGVSSSKELLKGLELAWESDPISAFGGIVGFSDEVDISLARFLNQYFIEAVIAPAFTEEALALLKEKKNLRIIKLPLKKSNEKEFVVRSINGGLLISDEDQKIPDPSKFENVTKKKFNDSMHALGAFGVIVSKYQKSNALVLVTKRNNDFVLLSHGVGQPNRIESLTMLLAPKIKNKAIDDSVLVSDAFFPFSDIVDECAKLKIANIIQPGGSIRDDEVIKSADDNNIAMVFTKTRHFRH